jgi:hypothetical protein
MEPTPEEVRLEGVSLERWESDLLRTRAHAARARLERTSGRVRAERVEADVFETSSSSAAALERHPGQAPRERAGHVVAGTAEGVLGGVTVTASRGVTVTDRAGRVLKTRRAIWELDRDRMLAPDAVRLNGANFAARGSSAAFDLGAQQVDVAGPITATVAQAKPR